jgi:hypothetical protein
MNTSNRILAMHWHKEYPLTPPAPRYHPADPYLIVRNRILTVTIWLRTDAGVRKISRRVRRNCAVDIARELWFDFKGRLLRENATYGTARNALAWLVNNIKRN